MALPSQQSRAKDFFFDSQANISVKSAILIPGVFESIRPIWLGFWVDRILLVLFGFVLYELEAIILTKTEFDWDSLILFRLCAYYVSSKQSYFLDSYAPDIRLLGNSNFSVANGSSYAAWIIITTPKQPVPKTSVKVK